MKAITKEQYEDIRQDLAGDFSTPCINYEDLPDAITDITEEELNILRAYRKEKQNGLYRVQKMVGVKDGCDRCGFYNKEAKNFYKCRVQGYCPAIPAEEYK